MVLFPTYAPLKEKFMSVLLELRNCCIFAAKISHNQNSAGQRIEEGRLDLRFFQERISQKHMLADISASKYSNVLFTIFCTNTLSFAVQRCNDSIYP